MKRSRRALGFAAAFSLLSAGGTARAGHGSYSEGAPAGRAAAFGPASLAPQALAGSSLFTPALLEALDLPDVEPTRVALERTLREAGLPSESVLGLPDVDDRVWAIRQALDSYSKDAVERLKIDVGPAEDPETSLARFERLAKVLPADAEASGPVLDARSALISRVFEKALESARARIAQARDAWLGGGGPMDWEAVPELVQAVARRNGDTAVALDRTLARRMENMRPLLERQARALQFMEEYGRMRRELAVSADPDGYMLSRRRVGARHVDAGELSELAERYVPGLDAGWFISQWDLFRDDPDLHSQMDLKTNLDEPIGFVIPTAGDGVYAPAPKLAVLDTYFEPFELFKTKIHEGYHQGDRFVEADIALRLLLGDGKSRVEPLFIFLIEGYTEWRTLRKAAEILRDGLRGASALARDFVAQTRAVLKNPLTLERAVFEDAKSHPYSPYVRFIDAAVAQFGEGPIRELVWGGSIAGLALAAGPGRLRALRALSEAIAAVNEAVTGRGLGSRGWLYDTRLFERLAKSMRQAVSGSLSEDEALWIAERAKELARRMPPILPPGRTRTHMIRAMETESPNVFNDYLNPRLRPATGSAGLSAAYQRAREVILALRKKPQAPN